VSDDFFWAAEGLVVLDGFGDAVVGIAERYNERVVVYDHCKVVEILVCRDGMGEEEAVEFIDYNIAGAFVGNGGPFLLVDRRSGESLDSLRLEVSNLRTENSRLKAELLEAIGASGEA
jgi:hypothetical protein